MHDHRSNKALLLARGCLSLSVLAMVPSTAQQMVAPVAGSAPLQRSETLVDALTCRVGEAALPGLMQQLRQQRPDDFGQSYRQYSAPPMDLYRLSAAVTAWGHDSDSVLISDTRIMMAVEGSMDAVSATLESALQSSESPLGGALDDAHALVVMDAGQPGLEDMVLLGCEYRAPGVSLLQNAEDTWRLPEAAEALIAEPSATPLE